MEKTIGKTKEDPIQEDSPFENNWREYILAQKISTQTVKNPSTKCNASFSCDREEENPEQLQIFPSKFDWNKFRDSNQNMFGNNTED